MVDSGPGYRVEAEFSFRVNLITIKKSNTKVSTSDADVNDRMVLCDVWTSCVLVFMNALTNPPALSIANIPVNENISTRRAGG